jgi:phosphoglucomutase
MLKGKTLCDAMDDVYAKYGYSFEKTTEIVTDGLDAKEKQERLMEALRTNPPKAFGSATAVKVGDLAARKFTSLIDNDIELSPFPSADVLMFYMDNGDIISVRPSGTEPKVKIYYLVTAESRALAESKYEGYKATLDAFVSATI